MSIARVWIEEGQIVEIFSQNHGLRLGIVSNIPPRRVVARVDKVDRETGRVHVRDADGVLTVTNTDNIERILAPKAEAGWMNL